jgi:hypothetical protein
MTGTLEMHEPHDRHEAPHMQAIRRRIESDVARHNAIMQRCGQPLGALIEQSAPLKLVQKRV